MFNLTAFTTTDLIALLAALLAFGTYFVSKWFDKRNAARIILQEILRAEEIIRDYKEFAVFKFRKKIIANNSWSNNIHLFVKDFDQEELNRISDLYSTGEYIDCLVRSNSDWQVEVKKQEVSSQLSNMLTPPLPPPPQRTESSLVPPASQPVLVERNIQYQLPNPYADIFKVVLNDYEFISNSPITEKLKKIARYKP